MAGKGPEKIGEIYEFELGGTLFMVEIPNGVQLPLHALLHSNRYRASANVIIDRLPPRNNMEVVFWVPLDDPVTVACEQGSTLPIGTSLDREF